MRALLFASLLAACGGSSKPKPDGMGVVDMTSHDFTVVDSGSPDSTAPDLGPSAPSIAAAVGYNVLTFNSTTLGTTPGTWQNFNFFGVTQPSGVASNNSDGSLSLTGTSGDSYNATLDTAVYDSSKPMSFSGIAFGGGGYFECTMSFTGTPTGDDKSPAFWAGDVEHASGYLPQTKGQTWIEIDDFETDVASDSKWGQSVHNWYNDGGSNTAANPQSILDGNPVSVPNNGTFNQSHTYAFLWVPATSTTQGYVKFYCDGNQIGGSALYDKYDASQAFPPTGSDIGNILDSLHLHLILGSDSTNYPATVTSVQVWQATDANNISQ